VPLSSSPTADDRLIYFPRGHRIAGTNAETRMNPNGVNGSDAVIAMKAPPTRPHSATAIREVVLSDAGDVTSGMMPLS
jgi:hypothetical protein